jgi:phosphoadenosine phosphosulfate reductase
MKFIGMNRYTTLGFREAFLEHFFDMQNDCWGSKELGNLQYASLKVWLKEAEIIEVNPQTDKNGQITKLGYKLIELGLYNPLTWAIIWANLSYNSSLIKWYLLCVKKGEIYEKGDLVFLIGDDYSERQRENAVSSLCETLGKSPIGNTLEMGVPISYGNTYKYHKKGWSTPDAAAILYTMYRYAEKLDGHYNITLKELQNVRDNRPENFIGMDPVTIFALNEENFKDMLRDLANAYPDYIKVAFVADLDNITLNNEKSSLDIVDLALGGE